MNARSGVRAEAATQVALMLGVGSVAASASWSHVVDLAAGHGQPGWLAVADAAVLETLAVSMGLEVRRRRRVGEPIRFAICVLVAAVALQLSAQVAQAPRSFWGWTMAALPAVGFLLLAKVAIARGGLTGPPAATQAARTPRRAEAHTHTRQAVAPASPRTAATPSTPVRRPDVASAPELLAAGREVADDLRRDDVALTRAALARGLRQRGIAVGTGRAGELLAVLRAEGAPPSPALALVGVGEGS